MSVSVMAACMHTRVSTAPLHTLIPPRDLSSFRPRAACVWGHSVHASTGSSSAYRTKEDGDLRGIRGGGRLGLPWGREPLVETHRDVRTQLATVLHVFCS